MPFALADDGCNLFYDLIGKVGALVVLIPGLGGDGRFWAKIAAILQPRFRVLMVDHRGAGRSGRPEGGYSIIRIAADVIAVLDHIGAPRAHIVGHSTGGAVAQTLALDWPDRVARLVISGSWEKPDARFRSLFEVRLALLKIGLIAEYQALTQVLGYDATYLAAHKDEMAADRIAAVERLTPVSVAAARIRMLLEFDRSADLHKITAPTLVVMGADDIMMPYHHSKAIAHAIPGAKLASIPGGHFYPLTAPKQLVQAIEDHLR